MKKYLVVVLCFLLMFVSPIYSQVNGKIISPSFSPVSQFVTSSIESNFVVLTNRSSFKLEIVYITPDGINAVSAGLDNDVLPGKSIKVLYTGNKGVKCYRAIAYKAADFDNENKSKGCELMKLQAKMGKEVCQAINGTNSCFSDAASVLEQNNWCDNSSEQNFQNSQQNNSQKINAQINPSTSSANNSDPIKEMQLKQQQTQQELNNAQDASTSAYEDAINSGKKNSGAMVDATLAGAQYISDPKASLAYTGVGLGVALISWISEKREAQRAEMLKREEEERQRRLEELKAVKASLKTSSTVFNFISSTTDYHYTNLKIEIKRKMVKSVSRKDLYDVTVEIHKVLNTTDSIFIYESVKFKNLATSTDSCVISKISIPLRYVKEAQLYNGDYTNAYDPKSSTNQIFRHKNLTNAQIQNAFTIVPMFNEGNQIGSIHSELIDVSIEMLGRFIKIQKKYTPSKPSTLNDADFDGISGFSANSYMLVFDANTWNANNFVDYLNFIKN